MKSHQVVFITGQGSRLPDQTLRNMLFLLTNFDNLLAVQNANKRRLR